MPDPVFHRYWKNRNFAAFALLCALGAAAVSTFVVTFGTTKNFELFGLAIASRTLNQFTAVLLTCMALVVPLTSNLYTPKLVRVYVSHPLIVVGLSILTAGQALVMATSYFPFGHPFHESLVIAVSATYLLVLTATLPYLYGLSHFLRPSYFVPLLTNNGIFQIERLERGRNPNQAARFLFETIDVVTNIALTGMLRGDRQLVLLALQSMHELLNETIPRSDPSEHSWRSLRPFYVPGLAREGQDYLMRTRIWPEAYLLAQMLKVMEGADKRRHEVLGELASHLLVTSKKAFDRGLDAIVELHVMAFNTLLRDAMDEKDLRRIQILSYHYRLLAEIFHRDPVRLHESVRHLIHYGTLSAKQGLGFALETVIYDIGELLLCIARRDQHVAVDLVESFVGVFLRDSTAREGHVSRVAWRTVVRLYWEARAASLPDLADQVRGIYLADENAHREQVEKALRENRELHFEFNDRLMRFAHLSPAAEARARTFLETGDGG